MPISADQWRASVGGYNASVSRMLGKCVGKKAPNSLQDLFPLFLVSLFTPGPWTVDGKAKADEGGGVETSSIDTTML